MVKSAMNERRTDVDLKSWKTTEFWLTVPVLTAIFAAQFFRMEGLAWSISFAGVLGSYIYCRGMFKKDRGLWQYSGQRSSEFYLHVAGIAVFWGELASGYITLNVAVLCVAFLQICYNLSRGHAKSMTQVYRPMPGMR